MKTNACHKQKPHNAPQNPKRPYVTPTHTCSPFNTAHAPEPNPLCSQEHLKFFSFSWSKLLQHQKPSATTSLNCGAAERTADETSHIFLPLAQRKTGLRRTRVGSRNWWPIWWPSSSSATKSSTAWTRIDRGKAHTPKTPHCFVTVLLSTLCWSSSTGKKRRTNSCRPCSRKKVGWILVSIGDVLIWSCCLKLKKTLIYSTFHR